MATPSLVALPMSSSKSELLKHLNLSLETYALMAKETNKVYHCLTSDEAHLKPNLKREPPYDWCDIQEKFKDEAITDIAKGGDEDISQYWRLAVLSKDCPNWIAKWILYHSFRYKDKRSKTQAKGSEKGRQPSSSSSGYTYHTSQLYDSADIAAKAKINHLEITTILYETAKVETWIDGIGRFHSYTGLQGPKIKLSATLYNQNLAYAMRVNLEPRSIVLVGLGTIDLADLYS